MHGPPRPLGQTTFSNNVGCRRRKVRRPGLSQVSPWPSLRCPQPPDCPAHLARVAVANNSSDPGQINTAEEPGAVERCKKRSRDWQCANIAEPNSKGFCAKHFQMYSKPESRRTPRTEEDRSARPNGAFPSSEPFPPQPRCRWELCGRVLPAIARFRFVGRPGLPIGLTLGISCLY